MKTFFILIQMMAMLTFTHQTVWAQGRSGRLSKVPGTKTAQTANEDTDDAGVLKRGPAQIIENRELIEKAKSHNYKGGAEEGELRVQAHLPKPQRKIAPVVEKTDEKETQDHD